ncbi:MAG TPA: hypothetical protein VGG72_07520 [Bryobacteraceae bacterium]|jgi:hypothetical protein
MEAAEQTRWLEIHIPNRIRAATARRPMENSLLQVTATIDPKLLTPQDRLFWRFATDSIWEGRLVTTRWLIEFVGIKGDRTGLPVQCRRSPNFPHDVYIDDLAGGVLFSPTATEAQLLAKVWSGCSQASSHATTDTHKHYPTNEKPVIKALTIILDYLQAGVYDTAGTRLRDYVLEPV